MALWSIGLTAGKHYQSRNVPDIGIDIDGAVEPIG